LDRGMDLGFLKLKNKKATSTNIYQSLSELSIPTKAESTAKALTAVYVEK